MNELGLTHIGLTIGAYALYFFAFLKFVSKSYPYKILYLANALYVLGFVLGMVWANSAWGYMLSLDSKIVISALVPIPFVVESLLKRKKAWLLGVGCLLILLNYFFPLLIGTIHTH